MQDFSVYSISLFISFWLQLSYIYILEIFVSFLSPDKMAWFLWSYRLKFIHYPWEQVRWTHMSALRNIPIILMFSIMYFWKRWLNNWFFGFVDKLADQLFTFTSFFKYMEKHFDNFFLKIHFLILKFSFKNHWSCISAFWE